MKMNFFAGMTISSWALALMVIMGELSAPFKTMLANTFSHHWIAKAFLVAVLFFAVSYLSKDREGKIYSERYAWHSAVGSLAVIFLFFVIEWFE